MEEIICEAIRSRISLHFNYRGGGCTVDPYCLGMNAEGEMVLLGYQRSGQALPGTLGHGTGWVTFPVDKLSDLKSTEIPFLPDKPDPKKKEKIVEIICCADGS
jgi:hypothetical protein